MRESSHTWFAIAAGAVLAASGCTEPRRVSAANPNPVAPVEARVDLSDSSASRGAVVVATLRLVGSPVATATLRLAYDSTGLAFAGADSLDDGTMRVINPMPGLVRIAAMAPSGIAEGKVHVLRFTVIRPTAVRTMKLSVDEAHTVSGANLASQVKVP